MAVREAHNRLTTGTSAHTSPCSGGDGGPAVPRRALSPLTQSSPPGAGAFGERGGLSRLAISTRAIQGDLTSISSSCRSAAAIVLWIARHAAQQILDNASPQVDLG